MTIFTVAFWFLLGFLFGVLGTTYRAEVLPNCLWPSTNFRRPFLHSSGALR